VITLSQILFSAPYSINKDYVWLQAQKFYNFNLILVTTLLDFLICGFHYCCFLSHFIFDLLLAWIIFPQFLILSTKPFKITVVFDYALVDSNMSKFFHYCSYVLCNMATFHVIGHSNLTIMVDKSRMTIVFEICLLS